MCFKTLKNTGEPSDDETVPSGTVLNPGTTTGQNCGAVPNRARI